MMSMMMTTVLSFLFPVLISASFNRLLPELKKEIITEYLDEARQLQMRLVSSKLNHDCNDPARKAFIGFNELMQILKDKKDIYEIEINEEIMSQISDIHHPLQHNTWYLQKLIKFAAEDLIKKHTFIDLYHGRMHKLLELLLGRNPTKEMSKALKFDKIRFRNYALIWGFYQSVKSTEMANILRLFYDAMNTNTSQPADLDILWQNAAFENYMDAYTKFNNEVFAAVPARLVAVEWTKFTELKLKLMLNFLTQLLKNNDYDLRQFKAEFLHEYQYGSSDNHAFKEFYRIVRLASRHPFQIEKFKRDELYRLLQERDGLFILYDMFFVAPAT